MQNDAKRTLSVKGVEIALIKQKHEDYISLTDMARPFGGDKVVENWLRNKNTIEFLGIWESLNNQSFKPLEFEGFKKEAGLNRFTLSSKKWIKATGAIGLTSKSGRYHGGTFAHKDIAFEFGSWLSPEFKLYLIKEFQRLKEEESRSKSFEWDVARILTKINYKIHTDAIKQNLIPLKIAEINQNIVYADEADVLNKALFGMTAREWRDKSPDKKGNVRDYAIMEQLVVLVNMESFNAELIKVGLSQFDRLKRLNEIAISQMKSLLGNSGVDRLKGGV
ncbi:TPA: DNA-binding protein [Candidatus Peregrinibacteria bacterium]|nr:DNA-binding protein [Candidatus Peregrinibacteria bacterium]